MYGPLVRWFKTKSFQTQIVVLALVLDPLGFAVGYLLAPSFDDDPIMGGVFGLVAASIPMSLFVTRKAR